VFDILRSKKRGEVFNALFQQCINSILHLLMQLFFSYVNFIVFLFFVYIFQIVNNIVGNELFQLTGFQSRGSTCTDCDYGVAYFKTVRLSEGFTLVKGFSAQTILYVVYKLLNPKLKCRGRASKTV